MLRITFALFAGEVSPRLGKSLDWDLAIQAATLAFVQEKANIALLCPSGGKKVHLDNAIGYLACLRARFVLFVLVVKLVDDVVAPFARNTIHRRLGSWSVPNLLINELDYPSLVVRAANLLNQVFTRRYRRSSTIVTTNLRFKEWGSHFRTPPRLPLSPIATCTKSCVRSIPLILPNRHVYCHCDRSTIRPRGANMLRGTDTPMRIISMRRCWSLILHIENCRLDSLVESTRD